MLGSTQIKAHSDTVGDLNHGRISIYINI